jgi:hypothetical protein
MMKKKILLVGSVGIAAGVLYALETSHRKQKRSAIREGDSAEGLKISGNDRASKGSSMASIEDGKPVIRNEADHAIDDQGTDQLEASQILQRIRDDAFDSSNEKLALALGRSAEEIEQWTNGSGFIDGDGLMKARALAIQRGLQLD